MLTNLAESGLFMIMTVVFTVTEVRFLKTPVGVFRKTLLCLILFSSKKRLSV